VEERFSAHVQTGNGSRASFPRIKPLGMALTNKPHLALRLNKEYSYTFMTCSRVKFVFTLFADVPIRFNFYDAVSV